MLETDIRKIDFWGNNIVKSHHVNLDTDLDCVIILSTKDEKFSELLYHKVIDSIIDRVHPKNVYKDLSNSLENINAFISTWGKKNERIKWLHGIIGVYHKKSFLFSTIWNASVCLYNTHKDIIEVTDREDSPKDFSFISNGDIADDESLILCNIRLLDILSKDDVRDGLSEDNLKRSGENIESILMHEHTWKNLAVISIKRESDTVQAKGQILEKIQYYFFKSIDNKITKKSLGYIYHLRDTIMHKSQRTKQVLLGVWILVSIFFLYTVISSFFQIASQTQGTEQAKIDLMQAKASITTAGENMNNPDMFNLNIEKAESIIQDLESKKLFSWDIELLRDNLWILQKQFNGVESFTSNSDSTMYTFPNALKIVKVLSVANMVYVVHDSSITGPIVQGETSQNHSFAELANGDSFIDASVLDNNIVLMTRLWKVVNFARNNFYSYLDVANQPTWEKSPIISSYASNLYLISDSWSQILRHRKLGDMFSEWDSYLSDGDAATVKQIYSLAIDGGIYILQEDGTILKLFREPEYRLESILLNKLPKNYSFWNINPENLPSLEARADLTYVYMLLHNRVLVFKPNSPRYQDVQSLNYIWQIEWKNIIIEDFYVDNDGEVFVAGQEWVYKISFDVVEDKIILK